MRKLFFKLMAKLTAYLDPRLEKYRPPKKKPAPYKPESKEELVKVLKRTSKSVLSDAERNLIAGAMTFPVVPVKDIMEKKRNLTYVHEEDSLDPLTLDRLYKTKQEYYPVLNAEENIVGLLKIDDFDALQLTEDKVRDHIDPEVCFVRGDYSLEMLLSAFLRSNSNFAIVIDHEAKIVGFVTLAHLMLRLFGRWPDETFDSDNNQDAVAKRSVK